MNTEKKSVWKLLPEPNKILVYWLGGAGFLFVFDNGQIVCIDPYLSDSVERLAGFRRLTMAPFSPSELIFDILLLTHDHPDHLDIDSFDELMTINPKCQILASSSCEAFLKGKNANFEVAKPGSFVTIGEVCIKTVAADHGNLCPDALGFLIVYKNRSIYCTGDTSNNFEKIKDAIIFQPEIMVTCINGAYGNLDEKEAAILASKCNAKKVIPCHFWLFAEHGGDPAKFRDHLKTFSPDSDLRLITPGKAEII